MILEPSITVSYEHSKVAWEAARESCERFQECSENGESENEPQEVNLVSWSDVKVNSLLGIGAFSDVYEVRINSETLDSTYALKCVSGKAIRNFEREYMPNATNLALETKILSQLRHKNIVTVHGTNSESDPKANQGQFLLLEILPETLQERLETMRKGKAKLLFSSSRLSQAKERLESCAVGICDAMQYIHEKNVILRDLKPANVGFDRNGVVKLFDFGLARHVDDCELAMAGSLRYMAPETIIGNGNTKKSDVYSFGIMLHEIVTLEKPFKKFKKVSKLSEKVVNKQCRPSTRWVPSAQLVLLIEDCWHADASKRPSFSSVQLSLRQVMGSLAAFQKPTLSRKGSMSASSRTLFLRALSLPDGAFETRDRASNSSRSSRSISRSHSKLGIFGRNQTSKIYSSESRKSQTEAILGSDESSAGSDRYESNSSSSQSSLQSLVEAPLPVSRAISFPKPLRQKLARGFTT